jgi:hypothetical protein
MSVDTSAHGTCLEWRTMRWIAAAIVIHALALLVLVAVSPRAVKEVRSLAAEASEGATEIAVEVESEERVEWGERVETRETETRARLEEGKRAETRATAEAVGTGTGTGTGETSGGVEVELGVPGTGTGVVPVPPTAGELGIGGRNPFLPRAEEKVPSGADHPAARAMRGTGLAHDRELGLGPEGPAIAALEGATTSSIAPLRGRAIFLVRTGGDGLVSAIDLIDSEGGTGWMDAGRIALERLRGKKLAIPRGASAMNMRIEVRSEMKLPNGERAPVTVRRGEADMPELTIPDISNLGAKPRRVIHARAVGTDVL